MRNLLLYITCLFLPVAGAQEITKSDTILIPAESRMTSDNLENLFVVTPTNDIIKYDKSGKKLATANFKVQGNITSLDVSNPFEIYVFYRDQNRIIFLDNLLNIRGECDLETIGISQVACIARSADNQIWLFDAADLKLKKYSKDLKLIIESASFNTFNTGPNLFPTIIRDINSSILVLDQNKVLEFDVFANFSKVKLIDTLQNFQYINDKLVFLKNNKVYMFNPANFTLSEMGIALPPDTKNIRIEKERLFVLTNEYVILQTFTEK